jgi:hypothetical protein
MAFEAECPKCGGASSSFVRGVCRACYMRDFHQRRSASIATDGEGRRICAECREPRAYARGLCRSCYMRDYNQRRAASDKQSASDKQRVLDAPTFICESEGASDKQRVLDAPTVIYESKGRRLCAECGEPSIYCHGLCLSCYGRDRRRGNRMKLCKCVVCGVSFQSARGDAQHCSNACRLKAYRARRAGLTSATITSSAAYATASAAAKVNAAALRGLYRPRRLLSVYRPVAASQVVPAARPARS